MAKMSFLQSIYDGYRDLMDNKSDPRTKDWPLMSSPFPTIAISLAYAYFVKVKRVSSSLDSMHRSRAAHNNFGGVAVSPGTPIAIDSTTNVAIYASVQIELYMLSIYWSRHTN
uniref:Uncharacterized protein n=1 Tax=Phlebotomus papatasi TaxID=29031 RepID=A0A1B0D2R7_PHLPP